MIRQFTFVRRLFFPSPFVKSASATSSIDETLLFDVNQHGRKMCSDSGATASTFDFAAVDKSISGCIRTNGQLEVETFLV